MEHRVKQIVFDCSELERVYGAGTAEVFYLPPATDEPYIVDAQQDGNNIIWIITDKDTKVAGAGGIMIDWHVNNVIIDDSLVDACAKWGVIDTYVIPSLGDKSII